MIELTADEMRMVQDARARKAMEAGSEPFAAQQQITKEEWHLLQLHRIAQQSRIPGSGIAGSGIAANLPDPLQQLHAVAIVMLRSLRTRVEEIAQEHGNITLHDVYREIEQQLAILGDHGTPETEPAGPGPGR